jgi:hypothetical protein
MEVAIRLGILGIVSLSGQQRCSSNVLDTPLQAIYQSDGAQGDYNPAFSAFDTLEPSSMFRLHLLSSRDYIPLRTMQRQVVAIEYLNSVAINHSESSRIRNTSTSSAFPQKIPDGGYG